MSTVGRSLEKGDASDFRDCRWRLTLDFAEIIWIAATEAKYRGFDTPLGGAYYKPCCGIYNVSFFHPGARSRRGRHEPDGRDALSYRPRTLEMQRAVAATAKTARLKLRAGNLSLEGIELAASRNLDCEPAKPDANKPTDTRCVRV